MLRSLSMGRDAKDVFTPPTGELQGDHGAPKKFVAVTTTPLGHWLNTEEKFRPAERALRTADPISGREVSLSMTKFVDDVAKKTVSSAVNMATSITLTSRGFTRTLARTGHAQNQDKSVHGMGVAGEGSIQEARYFYSGASPPLGR